MSSHDAACQAIDRFFEAYRLYISTESRMYPALSAGKLGHEAYEPLERELGVPLPWSFKEWHRRFHSHAIQVQGTYLPLSPAEAPIDDLLERVLALDHLTQGIRRRVVPIGYDEITQSVVALDARHPAEDHEWPVLFLKSGHESALDGAKIEHTSFVDLLEGLTRVIDRTLDPEEP